MLNKFILFTAIFAVIIASAYGTNDLKNGKSSTEPYEGLDLTKLSPEEIMELLEWAKSVNLTWEQIEALSEFDKEIRNDETNEERNVRVETLCKKFDTEPKAKAAAKEDTETKELAALFQTVRLLTLFELFNAKNVKNQDVREMFIALKEICHIINTTDYKLST